MNIQKTSHNIYISKNTTSNDVKNKLYNTNSPAFGANPTNTASSGIILRTLNTIGQAYKKILGPSIIKMAGELGKLAESKPAEKLINWTDKHPIVKDNLLSHLLIFGSTLLSGFYVAKTLNNEKMDKDKRRTLAINQGATFIVSTIMAYTFDGWARKKFNENILTNFKLANKDVNNLKQLEKGMGIARTTIIIDMVYRFIAPVLVTPFANHIGNKIQEKHQ